MTSNFYVYKSLSMIRYLLLRGRRSQCILNEGWRCKQYNALLLYKLKNIFLDFGDLSAL